MDDQNTDEHGEKTHICLQCSKPFSRKDALKVHVSQVHSKKKTHSCQTCGKLFSVKWSLARHKILVHDKVKKYHCKDCPFKAGQKNDLQRHAETVHSVDGSKITDIYKAEKNHKCEQCGKMFQFKKSLKRHTKVHIDSQKYKCEDCPSSFSRGYNLKVHIANVHKGEKNFKCEKCGFQCSRKSNLLQHMKSHFGNKTYKYDHCPQEFTMKEIIELSNKMEITEDVDAKEYAKIIEDEKIENETDLKCDECQKHFVKGYDLRVHQETEHLKAGNYECRICNQQFEQIMELTKHVEDIHQNSVTYGCNFCGQAFNTESELQEHSWSDHNQYVCKVCNESLDGKDQFKDHYVKEHFMPEIINIDEIEDEENSRSEDLIAINSNPNDDGCNTENSESNLIDHMNSGYKNKDDHAVETKQQCDICDETFEQKVDVKKHLSAIHFVVDDGNSDTDDEIITNTSLEDESPISEGKTSNSCKTDLNSYAEKDDGNQDEMEDGKVHDENNVKNNPCSKKQISCHRCERIFTSEKRLQNHIKSCQKKCGKSYKCNQCNETFTIKSILKVHFKSTHGEYIPKCDKCEKVFSTKDNLKKHAIVHNGEKKYHCKSCGKSFGLNATLKRHVETVHHGIKRFKCNKCEKAYAAKRRLLRHVGVVHNGEKPINFEITRECKHCGKSFGFYTSWKRHVETVHKRIKKFRCEECNAAYADVRLLKQHKVKAHESQANIVCKKCNIYFSSQIGLKSHLKKVHKSEKA